MTTLTDNIWIKAGINAEELKAVKGRTALYVGMFGLGFLSLMFAGLALGNILERLI